MKNAKDPMGERLQKIRKHLYLSQTEFAEKIHLTHGQVSSMELGRSKINTKNIELICTPNRFKEKTTVNKDYLVLGEGDILIHQKEQQKFYDEDHSEIPFEEEQLVLNYRKLGSKNKELLIAQIEFLLKFQQENKKEEMEEMKKNKRGKKTFVSVSQKKTG